MASCQEGKEFQIITQIPNIEIFNQLANAKFSRAFCSLFCLTLHTFTTSDECIFTTVSHATSLVNVGNKIIIGEHLGIIGFYLILRVEDPPQTEDVGLDLLCIDSIDKDIKLLRMCLSNGTRKHIRNDRTIKTKIR